ncbi:MAG: ribonuclease [Solirubrobacterales bacterium]|jgi:membrane protein|nr:ribonuclease [Solirubrobacterales bacterium]
MQRARRAVARFWRAAYAENITGQSAMVAYNLLLSIFPLALLALFIGGELLSSPELEDSVLEDLQRLFPGSAATTLRHLLDQLRHASTNLGIGAILLSIWFGASFWGSLDTAFCRIYHARCRTWLEQKRFALGMLAVVLVFMATTVAAPTVQSILVSGAGGLPFGLNHVRGIVLAASLTITFAVLFGTLCLIYWRVPNFNVPWSAVWPGAAAATLAIAVIDYAFPLYLSNISTIARFGTTFVFVVIVLAWFYALAIILLGGATINALRMHRDE